MVNKAFGLLDHPSGVPLVHLQCRNKVMATNSKDLTLGLLNSTLDNLNHMGVIVNSLLQALPLAGTNGLLFLASSLSKAPLILSIISQVSLELVQMTATLAIARRREDTVSRDLQDSKVMGSRHLDSMVILSQHQINSRTGKPISSNLLHMGRQGLHSKVMGPLHPLLRVIHSKAMDSKVFLKQVMDSQCLLNKLPLSQGMYSKEYHNRAMESKGQHCLDLTSRLQLSQQGTTSQFQCSQTLSSRKLLKQVMDREDLLNLVMEHRGCSSRAMDNRDLFSQCMDSRDPLHPLMPKEQHSLAMPNRDLNLLMDNRDLSKLMDNQVLLNKEWHKVDSKVLLPAIHSKEEHKVCSKDL